MTITHQPWNLDDWKKLTKCGSPCLSEQGENRNKGNKEHGKKNQGNKTTPIEEKEREREREEEDEK